MQQKHIPGEDTKTTAPKPKHKDPIPKTRPVERAQLEAAEVEHSLRSSTPEQPHDSSSTLPATSLPGPRTPGVACDDSRNVHSFRIENPKSAKCLPSPSKVPLLTSDIAAPAGSHHQLIGRLKTLIGDIVAHVRKTGDSNADEYLTLTEDAIRSIKQAKVEARDAFRRVPSDKEKMLNETVGLKERKSGERKTTPPGAQDAPRPGGKVVATRSYAAALRGTKSSEAARHSSPKVAPPPGPPRAEQKAADVAHEPAAPVAAPIVQQRDATPGATLPQDPQQAILLQLSLLTQTVAQLGSRVRGIESGSNASNPGTEQEIPQAATPSVQEAISSVPEAELRPQSWAAKVAASKVEPAKEAEIPQRATPPQEVKAPAAPTPSKVEPAQRQREGTLASGDRQAVARRDEERQKAAEERRRNLHSERQRKQLEVTERVREAKFRREQAAERIRQESQEKAEAAVRRGEEATNRVKEKALRDTNRVDEVLFMNELESENRALQYESETQRFSEQLEARREEMRQAQKGKSDAHQLRTETVLERGKELSKERQDKLHKRAEYWTEKVKQVEETKRRDSETKQKSAEEWGKKIQDLQQKAQAEVETKAQKIEEKAEKSAQLREEHLNLVKMRAEKEDQKAKEARERRENVDTGLVFREIMAGRPAEEEKRIDEKLSKAAAAMVRQGQLFSSEYQNLQAANMAKVKVRSILTRICRQCSANPSQSKTLMRELLGTLREGGAAGPLTSIEHEYLRFTNIFEVLQKAMFDCPSAESLSVSAGAEIVQQLLQHPVEGPAHASYFLQAGHILPFIVELRKEMTELHGRRTSPKLASCLSIVQLCAKHLQGATSPKLAPMGPHIVTYLQHINIESYCLALATTGVRDEELSSMHHSLLLLLFELQILGKRKTFVMADDRSRRILDSLFTMLATIVTPSGLPLRPTDALSSQETAVLFTALRIICTVTRMCPVQIINALGPDQKATLQELFHITCGVLSYIAQHEVQMERIPSTAPAASYKIPKSYADALQFGLTHAFPPRADAETSKHAGFLRALLHELLLFLGYVSLQNPAVQEIFSWGRERPLLTVLLSSMPIQYFTLGRHVLFPTLACICFEDDQNLALLKRDADVAQLAEFFTEQLATPPMARDPLRDKATQEKKSEPLAEISGMSWTAMMEDEDAGKPFESPIDQLPADMLREGPSPEAKARGEVLRKLFARHGSLQLPDPHQHFMAEKRFPVSLWPRAEAYFLPPLTAAAPQ